MQSGARGIRVVIADDLTMFREAVRSLLEREADLRVAGEAGNSSDTLDLVRKSKPDVLLLDLAMARASDMELLRRLVDGQSAVRIILLADVPAKKHVGEALALGAHGFITRRADAKLLLKSIRSVASGEYWVGHREISDLIDYFRNSVPRPREKSSDGFKLTPREFDIITEIVDGRTNQEIAEKLSISVQTVKHHLTSIFSKVGVNNRLELALRAMHKQLVADY